jgi:hypothetical protein
VAPSKGGKSPKCARPSLSTNLSLSKQAGWNWPNRSIPNEHTPRRRKLQRWHGTPLVILGDRVMETGQWLPRRMFYSHWPFPTTLSPKITRCSLPSRGSRQCLPANEVWPIPTCLFRDPSVGAYDSLYLYFEWFPLFFALPLKNPSTRMLYRKHPGFWCRGTRLRIPRSYAINLPRDVPCRAYILRVPTAGPAGGARRSQGLGGWWALRIRDTAVVPAVAARAKCQYSGRPRIRTSLVYSILVSRASLRGSSDN